MAVNRKHLKNKNLKMSSKRLIQTVLQYIILVNSQCLRIFVFNVNDGEMEKRW